YARYNRQSLTSPRRTALTPRSVHHPADCIPSTEDDRMMRITRGTRFYRLLAVVLLSWMAVPAFAAELPGPVLNAVFPPGGQAGTTVTVTLEGIALDGLRDIRTTVPGLTARKADGDRFSLTIPAETSPGVYDLRAVGLHGL